jgi:hypothetical protein
MEDFTTGVLSKTDLSGFENCRGFWPNGENRVLNFIVPENEIVQQ